MNKEQANSYYGIGRKKFSSYIIGYSLCIILTLISFLTVMYSNLSGYIFFAIIFGAALIQFFVQVAFFLRLNTKDNASRLNVMVFVFSLVILGVIAGGSLWIMWCLNYNMVH